MVALPGLDSYSDDQLRELRALSPAFARYETLLKNGISSELHGQRHKAWMKCAAATLLKNAATPDICRYWSDEADAILETAWFDAGLADKPAALFALGKHGAQELNLSSDIDVLIVAEP